MGAKTRVEWTALRRPDGIVVPGHTFNIVWGCEKVSPACTHCYAEAWAKRTGYDVWGPAKTTARKAMSQDYWKQPLKWNRAAEQAGERHKVFCSSMADVFEEHPTVNEQRERLWPLIQATPALDWLLLTKRPEHIERMVPLAWLTADGHQHNVWFGFTAENQDYFNRRWAAAQPLAERGYIVFVSAEPLLGPITLPESYLALKDRGWLLVGGESGPRARPMLPQWARSLRDQARSADVAFFFKQWGQWAHIEECPLPLGKVEKLRGVGSQGEVLPADAPIAAVAAWMWRAGKGRSGRTLNGVEWNECPVGATEVRQECC